MNINYDMKTVKFFRHTLLLLSYFSLALIQYIIHNILIQVNECVNTFCLVQKARIFI
jgi:hypothetical protein